LRENKFWKVGFIVLFAVFLVLVAFFAHSYGKNKTGEVQTQTPGLSTQVTPTGQTVSEEEAIKEAVYKKFNSDETKLRVTISEINGNYAKGGIVESTSEVGGGYFIAAKVSGNWVIVYDGQVNPSCSQIAQYNFPKEMVPECLDSKGAVVTR